MTLSTSSDHLHIQLPPVAVSDTWRELALERQEQLTKPRGSLGRLEELAIQLASIQRVHQPSVNRAQAIIFAADHPVARRGTSAYPVEVTAAMVGHFLAGGAASSVLAQSHGIPLSVVDVGVDTPYEPPTTSTPDLYLRHHMQGGDISVEPALTPDHFAEAVSVGRQRIARLPHDLNLLILGEMGIGNTTASSAVAAAILGDDVETLVGRGTGVDDEALSVKTQLVSRAVDRWSRQRESGEPNVAEVMRHLGGREMAAVLGAMLESVQRGVAILVDGFIISVVALVLVRLYPEAQAYLIFSHRSQEQGHQRVLAALDAAPLLSLDLRLGEASGALSAYPLLSAACDLHNRMATFAEAAVPDQDEAL